MTRPAIALLAFLTVVSFAHAQQAAPSKTAHAACGTPTVLGDGWSIAKPEDAGLDGARLCDIAARLTATEANVHGIVIARRGKLVFEQYFPGQDSPWNAAAGHFEFSAETKHDMRSISKSVTSLLLGIALDRKLIANVDEPVLKFFPEDAALKTPGWEKITLRHLLTMSSGLEWNENLPWNPKNDEWHLANDKDPLSYVLRRPVARAKPQTTRQIVSADWIADSIKPRFQTIGSFGGLFFYGYTWWMGRTLAGEKEVTWIAGIGLGGQRLFAIPALDIVVMMTSGLYSSPRQGNAGLDILYRFVIPAVR